MQASIAIIELYQHDEVLRHYLELLDGSDHNIKVFCSKVVYDCLEDFWASPWIAWVIQQEGQTITTFLAEHQTEIQRTDLVFITTALSAFQAFYNVAKGVKTLLLLHNVHSFLAPQQYLLFENTIADRLRYWKLLLQRSFFYKKRLLQVVKGIAFPTDQILAYVEKTFPLPASAKRMSLPFAYFYGKEPQPDRVRTITIPGTVDTALRDYQTVWNAFSKMKISQKTRLVFLGKVGQGSASVVKQFKMLQSDHLEVLFFQKFISPEIYEAELLKTDFLILPFKQFVRNHIFREELGCSKISGTINDLIRFGIPALIPEYYPIEDHLQSITTAYQTETLSAILEDWMNKELFIEKRNLGKLSLEQFNKEQRQVDFLKKITLLLNVI